MAANIYNMDELNGGSCAIPPHHHTTRAPERLHQFCRSDRLRRQEEVPGDLPEVAHTPIHERHGSGSSAGFPGDHDPISHRHRRVSVRPLTDDYLRIVDGSPEIDPANNSHVYAAQHRRHVPGLRNRRGVHGPREPAVVYNVGSGAATVYLEGKAISGTWKKTSTTALTRFYDSSGAEIPLVRGEIFLESVMPDTKVVVG